MLIRPRAVILSSVIQALMNECNRRRELVLLSHSHEVTGKVAASFNNTNIFGYNSGSILCSVSAHDMGTLSRGIDFPFIFHQISSWG